MRTRRLTKVLIMAQIVFRKRVVKHLLELGATQINEIAVDGMYDDPKLGLRTMDFVLQTPAGKLDIHVDDNCIMQRFNNLENGVAFTKAFSYGNESNRSSGKWNFHFGDEHIRYTLNCESDWQYCLGRLMAIPMGESFADRLAANLKMLRDDKEPEPVPT